MWPACRAPTNLASRFHRSDYWVVLNDMPLPIQDQDRMVFKAHDGYRKSRNSRNISRHCALHTCKSKAAPNDLRVCAKCKNVWYCVRPIT